MCPPLTQMCSWDPLTIRVNINVHWIDEMTFKMKRKLIQVIPEVGVKISSGGQPLYQFVVNNFKYILEDMDEDVGYI